MRTLSAILLLCLAVGASAGTITDIRTGLIPVGQVADVTGAVVTVVQNNSFTVTELPAGPYSAIWVYQGSTPSVSPGDVVDIRGLVRDNDGRSELNLLWPADAGVVITGSTVVPDLFVTSDVLHADQEPWESHLVTITDGMIVQALLSDGHWSADSVETGLPIVFDDYFYDYATVELGECYNNALGMITWYADMWVFKVLSVAAVDCTVADEPVSFGSLKASYR